MLETLYVKNLALIDEAEVNFGPGLNILSGETGAGKSILLGSIQIALGGKVPRDMIRTNEDSAYIELTFSFEDEEQKEALKRQGAELLDGKIVISRKLSAGRSVSRVNGEFWSAAKVAALSETLLDVYGQNEHQTLLKRSSHLEIVDDYAGDQIAEIKARVRDSYTAYRSVKKELESMNEDEGARLREAAFLQFAVDEIEEADLTPGEDEVLAARYKKLVNQRQLQTGMERLHEILGYDERDSVGEQISEAMRVLSGISSFDAEGLKEIEGELYDLESLVSDINQSVSTYAEDFETDEEALSETEKRLDGIADLKSKYGSTIEEILSYAVEQEKRLEELEHYEERKEELKKEEERLEQLLARDCEELSERRKKAAAELEERIRKALLELNFLQVKFQIAFERKSDVSENGIDDVEFLISLNPGEPLKPLTEVASGGELSRIMLAIKTVLADEDHTPTLIFDEIDAGISGRTAQMVAEKLAYIAMEHQVICISHLPQIVSMAEDHFLIEKVSGIDQTNTRIYPLSEDESVKEIARILGGAKITETTVKNAREMKEQAARRRKEVRVSGV